MPDGSMEQSPQAGSPRTGSGEKTIARSFHKAEVAFVSAAAVLLAWAGWRAWQRADASASLWMLIMLTLWVLVTGNIDFRFCNFSGALVAVSGMFVLLVALAAWLAAAKGNPWPLRPTVRATLFFATLTATGILQIRSAPTKSREIWWWAMY